MVGAVALVQGRVRGRRPRGPRWDPGSVADKGAGTVCTEAATVRPDFHLYADTVKSPLDVATVPFHSNCIPSPLGACPSLNTISGFGRSG